MAAMTTTTDPDTVGPIREALDAHLAQDAQREHDATASQMALQARVDDLESRPPVTVRGNGLLALAVGEPWYWINQESQQAYANPDKAATFDGGRYAKTGGMARDHGLNGPLKGDWKDADYDREATDVGNAGLDGLFMDVTTPRATDPNWKRIMGMTAALTRKKLLSVPMMDGNGGGIGGANAMAIPDVVASLVAFYKTGAGRVDGDLWLSSFKAELGTHPDGTKHTIDQAVAYWTELLRQLNLALGERVRFIAGTLDAKYHAAFAPIADVLSTWGPARPGNVPSIAAMAAAARRLGRQAMTSLRFQDMRPKDANWAEPNNSELFRGMLPMPGLARFIQVVTWNDWSETTSFCPSRNNGTALSKLLKIALDAWRTGTAWTVTKDTIFVSARTQLTTRQATMPNQTPFKRTLDGGGTPREKVEALCILLSDATVSVNGGPAVLVKAGVPTAVLGDLVEDAVQKVSVIRSTAPVAVLETPWATTSTPKVYDPTYRVAAYELAA